MINIISIITGILTIMKPKKERPKANLAKYRGAEDSTS